MSKNNKHLVSVIMPVYNGSSFMNQAIESIIKQTYNNWELLIIDDASTDKTWSIIKDYQSRYPHKIKSFRLKRNQGAFQAANIAFKKAKGEFMAPMDSDDISHPQRLERQVKFMLKNPKVIVLGTQAYLINAKNQIIGKKHCPTTHEEIYQQYAYTHPIVHPSSIIRRSLLPNKQKVYETKYGVNDDYYTLIRLLQFGEFANLEEYLFFYRIHRNNNSLKNLKKKYWNTFLIRLEAIFKYHYKISLLGLIVLVSQSFLATILPEKIAKSLYFLIRGYSKSAA